MKSHSCRWFRISPRKKEKNYQSVFRSRNLNMVDSCDTRHAYPVNFINCLIKLLRQWVWIPDLGGRLIVSGYSLWSLASIDRFFFFFFFSSFLWRHGNVNFLNLLLQTNLYRLDADNPLQEALSIIVTKPNDNCQQSNCMNIGIHIIKAEMKWNITSSYYYYIFRYHFHKHGRPCTSCTNCERNSSMLSLSN